MKDSSCTSFGKFAKFICLKGESKKTFALSGNFETTFFPRRYVPCYDAHEWVNMHRAELTLKMTQPFKTVQFQAWKIAPSSTSLKQQKTVFSHLNLNSPSVVRNIELSPGQTVL